MFLSLLQRRGHVLLIIAFPGLAQYLAHNAEQIYYNKIHLFFFSSEIMFTLIFSKNTTQAFPQTSHCQAGTTSLINNGWSFLEPSNLIYKWQNKNCHLGLSKLTLFLLPPLASHDKWPCIANVVFSIFCVERAPLLHQSPFLRKEISVS